MKRTSLEAPHYAVP